MNNLPTPLKFFILALIAIIIIVSIVFALIASRNEEDNKIASTNKNDQIAPNLGEQDITLNLEEQNNSNQTGQVSITLLDAQTRVRVFLENFPQNEPQPVHIHSGSCNDLGEVRYPLNNVHNGSSETILDIPFEELVSQKPLAINVHKSEAELQTYVSCVSL